MPLHVPDRKYWPPSRLAALATALIGAAATGAGFGIVAGLLFGISLGGLALVGAYYEARENEDKERQIDNARLSVTLLVMSPTPEMLEQLKPLAFDYKEYLRIKSGRPVAEAAGTARHTPPVAWGRGHIQYPEEPATPPSPPSEPTPPSEPPTMKALEKRIREQEEQIRQHFSTEDYYDYYTRRPSQAILHQNPNYHQDELPSRQPPQNN